MEAWKVYPTYCLHPVWQPLQADCKRKASLSNAFSGLDRSAQWMKSFCRFDGPHTSARLPVCSIETITGFGRRNISLGRLHSYRTWPGL